MQKVYKVGRCKLMGWCVMGGALVRGVRELCSSCAKPPMSVGTRVGD